MYVIMAMKKAGYLIVIISWSRPFDGKNLLFLQKLKYNMTKIL
jgi:hypothetical protein